MAGAPRPPPPPSLRGHATLQALLGRAGGRRPVLTFDESDDDEEEERGEAAARPPPPPSVADGACPLCGRAPASPLPAHVDACLARAETGTGTGRQATLSTVLGKRGERDQATAAPPAPPPSPRSFDTHLVARRPARAVDAPPGTEAALVRDRANPADAAAVAARAGPAAPLGYLPRPVAAVLAPALDAGTIAGVAVLPEGATGGRPAAVRVTLSGATAAAVAAAARAAAASADTAPAAAARACLAEVVGGALGREGHLWSEREARALRAMQSLPPAPAALFLTLYRSANTAKWHPVADPSSAPAVAAVVAAGLAAPLPTARAAPVAAAAAALTVPALRAALAAAGAAPVSRATRRPDLLRAVAAAVRSGERGRGAVVAALGGGAVRLRGRPATALRRAERVYWGDEEASVADAGGAAAAAAAAAAAGAPPPPAYTPAPLSLFPARADLAAYEAALGRAGALDDALCRGGARDGDAAAAVRAALAPVAEFVASGAHRAAPPPPSLPPFLADRVTGAAILCRAAHVGAAWLERAGAAAEASALLRALLGGPHLRAKRGAWWERLAINAERAGRPGEALEIAEAALADGAVVGGARLGLQRRVLRLGRPPRRWGAPSFDRGAALWEPPVTTIQGAPQASIVGVKSRFALAPTAAAAVNGEAVAAPPPPPTTVSVEGLALHHYAAAGGWAGAHGEGGPWARLLHLLLAAPVWGAAPPGALRVPGLAHPADLGCAPHFYEARAAALDAALAGIAAEDPPSLAARVVAAARGRGAAAAPRGLTVADLADVAACAGGPRVAAILSLIVRAGGTASAFPDLTLWRVARRRGDGLAAAGDARLVEVKGPRDRLSDGQRWVLAELARAGVACEVLKVVEPKKKKGGGGVA